MRYSRMILAAVLIGTLAAPTFGRNALKETRPAPLPAASTPVYCNTFHDVGRISLAVSNDGTLGYELAVSSSRDYFTGEEILPCEYPKGSRTQYLCGAALWIGAVVDGDTMVSTGADGWAMPGNEFHPDERPMIYRSTLDRTRDTYIGAVSEEDYVAVYYDTCRSCSGVSADELDGRAHIPLNLEITQQSFAWSFPYVDDFVLLDYSFKNIGTTPLSNVYIGMYVDGDVHDMALDGNQGAQDDFTGFQGVVNDPTRPAECPGTVDLNLAWIADNNGDLGQFVYKTVPNVTGVRVLGAPSRESQVSYNWWISNGNNPQLDFGPQARATYRNFGTGGTGTPVGDRNKYHVLRNGEHDYDQYRIATIGPMDPIWLEPTPARKDTLARGLDTRYCLSWGPFSIEPGETMPLALAYVGGMNFHLLADNLNNLPYDPDAWYAGVNFDSLTVNAIWADWVYDNPGIDTDSDGYKGEFELCGDDTVWVTGDGVPDYRAAGAPTAPELWAEPIGDGLRLRWNGFVSETSFDWLSQANDFEGYRAYISNSGQLSDYALVGSYDIEDYYRYYWDNDLHDWAQSPRPFTVGEAICFHAPEGCDDQGWHPLDYPRAHPFFMPGSDSVFYFEPVGPNSYVFELETPFVKPYPDAPKPPYATPSQVPDDEKALYLTADGYFKYYEYQFTIKELVPGQTYWVAVTAYDYGSTVVRGAFESGLRDNVLSAVPVEDFDGCCVGLVGNIDCSFSETPTLSDVYRLIDFIFVSELPLCCVAEADVDGSGGADPTVEDISLGDLGMMIWYMFLSHQDYPECR